MGLVHKASASRAADLGSILAFLVGGFPWGVFRGGVSVGGFPWGVSGSSPTSDLREDAVVGSGLSCC